MLNAVTVTNFKGESLRMELSKPEETGMLIYNITGIGSTTASINTTDMATMDGARFNSARAQTRNIVLTIALVDREKETVEDSRHRAYRYFPVKKKCTLEFETDRRTSIIEGYTESNDPTIFSSDEYTQISIICPDPYFRSKAPVETIFTGVDPLFEFPFHSETENEDPPEDWHFIEMGEIRNETVYDVQYNGDVDVGVIITIQVSGDVRNLVIYNTETHERMAFNDEKIAQAAEDPIKEGDILTISTIKNNKYARLQRGTKVYNILNCLDRSSDWIQLTQGNNIIAYTATEGVDDITFKITNYELYEGV